MTEPLFAPAGPVFSIDGARVPSMARDCVRLEIEEGVEGLRTLRLHLFATGAGATGPPDRMIYLDGGAVDFGKRLAVALGPDGSQQTGLRRGDLGDRGGLRRRPAHAGGDLRRGRSDEAAHEPPGLRSYTKVTDADLASSIATEHGLKAEVDVDGPQYDVVQQLNQSDLAFLRERARLVQAELWCETAGPCT